MEMFLSICSAIYYQLVWLVCWPFMKRSRYTTTASKLNRIPNMGYGCGEIIKLINRDYGAELPIDVTGTPRFWHERYRWTFRFSDTTIVVTE